jgi:hypothetical protein
VCLNVLVLSLCKRCCFVTEKNRLWKSAAVTCRSLIDCRDVRHVLSVNLEGFIHYGDRVFITDEMLFMIDLVSAV